MIVLAVVVLLRVVAVYLLSRLADLLDHEEVSFALDNPFDSRLSMSGDDDEVVALPHDRRIAGGWNFDRLQTRTSPALAVEGQGIGDLMLLGALLDSLVHAAEDLFVARRSFSEIHCQLSALSAWLARPAAQSGACLLQKRHALPSVDFTPHSLPPLTTGTALVGNVPPSLSSLDATPPVGNQSPLRSFASRAERDGQKQLLLG